MDENVVTTIDNDDETKSTDAVDTDDILLEMLADKKAKATAQNSKIDKSDNKSKTLEKEKKKAKGKKLKPVKKQTSRKQVKKRVNEKTITNALAEDTNSKSRQSSNQQSPRSPIELSPSELKTEKSDVKSRRSSVTPSRKNSSESSKANADDNSHLDGEETTNAIADNETGNSSLIERNENSNESVDDKDFDQFNSVKEDRQPGTNKETNKDLKKPPPIHIPDLSEESMLFTDLMVTKHSGSEWEKLVQNTAYSPGSTIQLMRAASIKRRHLSDPDVASSDATGKSDFIKPTFTLNQDQILLDDENGSGSPGSPSYPGNMFKFGNKRSSILPPINQSGQHLSPTRRTSIQKVPSKLPGAANLNLSVKLPKLEPVKRRFSQNVPVAQPQTTERPEWPKPTKIGRGWRIIRRHIIAGMFGHSLNRIRVGKHFSY